jgi:hypothetical protein
MIKIGIWVPHFCYFETINLVGQTANIINKDVLINKLTQFRLSIIVITNKNLFLSNSYSFYRSEVQFSETAVSDREQMGMPAGGKTVVN